MSVLTRPAVLLATASMAVGLIAAPGAAWAADAGTPLSAAEMKIALKAVADASLSAGAGGWRADMDMTVSMDSSSLHIAKETRVDPARGLYFDVLEFAGRDTVTYAAEGKGVYQSLDDPTADAALTMMGRPSVTFVFTADTRVRLDEMAPSPASLLDAYSLAGTKTVHEDGSAEFRVVSDDETVTMHTSAAAVLTEVDVTATADEATTEGTVDYTYGAQDISLPAASATIDEATLMTGVAYLDMPAMVKSAATQGAAATRKAAKGRTVKVATLRKLVRRDVTAANQKSPVPIVKAKDITGGVRVYATNPWTKKSVAYTVKASGKKVTLKKA
ncbi:hypothetical protein QLQ12_19630 [Actinoplanes sp. NEAU-A12]|uniref:DUF2092 domain-containing protein n=1 Tax=Actinoplanes sandaracinus TaxID=3045177 RepID=A0ABT6WM58_9ACTN|nr:hypothetical protein [Actinoplanes sandaracinus]MDI6100826.1 hypothetical protein [Actinoplanes sandaracinus]